MKILVAKTFGIGNAVCAVPMLKAIRAANPNAQIDLLIGSLPDDFGAREIFRRPAQKLGMRVFVDQTKDEYDVAVLGIPFDGRWKNGVHFKAKKVLDGRSRPDPSTTGFVSWKKHEVEYQMENAAALGYSGPIPDCSFASDDELLATTIPALVWKEKSVYLGVGYKKDQAGFWKQKHFGNEKFAELVKLLLASDPQLLIRSTGDAADMQLSMGPIQKLVQDGRYIVQMCDLEKSFLVMASCGSYVGNDTGMAHVAASLGKKVVVYFNMENAWTKSHPWCPEHAVVNGVRRNVDPQEMFSRIQELRNV